MCCAVALFDDKDKFKLSCIYPSVAQMDKKKDVIYINHSFKNCVHAGDSVDKQDYAWVTRNWCKLHKSVYNSNIWMKKAVIYASCCFSNFNNLIIWSRR